MERYTEKHYGENGYYLVCSGNCETLNCGDCGILGKIVDRLAAYEGTGLEPEEISKIREDVENGYLKSTARRYGVSVGRLRELAEADRDGRCVVLPIKIPGWGWYCNSKFPNAISAYFDYPSQVVGCMEDYILRGTKKEAEAALEHKKRNSFFSNYF